MIKSWQYLDEYEAERSRILEIVDRVFSSGSLILGAEVERFEKAFAAYCGVSYGVGVNSGTDALVLALKALGIGQGDEVVTVANTAVPTIAAIRTTGALPVFVDVEEDTFLIDAAKVEAAITGRTRCILPVHLFGQPADMNALREMAARHGAAIVEDCAQAAGARYKEAKVGGFGEIAAFSFYPTKVLGGYGDGGMAVTSSRALHKKLRRLRFYGMEAEYHAEEEGYNSRLDEVQAALLSHKLASLDEQVQKRQRIALAYSVLLAGIGDIVPPAVRPDRTHQFYVYTLRTLHRDGLRQHLLECGVEGRIHYPAPVHRMRGYDFLGYGPGSLPVTERLAGEILSLPLYPGLSLDDVERVVRCVKSYFDGTSGGGR